MKTAAWLIIPMTGFLVGAPVHATLSADAVGALYYTRAGTDLDIVIELDLPLTASQLTYVNSELDLLPSTNLEGLQTIDFAQIESDVDEVNEDLYLSYPDELFIQAPGTSNAGIQITLRPSVGARLFDTLPENEKQPIRDLYQASSNRLDDQIVSEEFGAWYAGWSANSDQLLDFDLNALISQAQTGQPPSFVPALDKDLTAASFYVTRGRIPFYSTPSQYPPQVSGQRVMEPENLTSSMLRLGNYQFLVSNQTIVGVISFNEGPTYGQPVYFQTPVTLPALAWQHFGASQPPTRRSISGDISSPNSMPPSNGISSSPARASYVIGPNSPSVYTPVLTPGVQGPHLVKTLPLQNNQ